jgi:hypothetical protein
MLPYYKQWDIMDLNRLYNCPPIPPKEPELPNDGNDINQSKYLAKNA